MSHDAIVAEAIEMASIKDTNHWFGITGPSIKFANRCTLHIYICIYDIGQTHHECRYHKTRRRVYTGIYYKHGYTSPVKRVATHTCGGGLLGGSGKLYDPETDGQNKGSKLLLYWKVS